MGETRLVPSRPPNQGRLEVLDALRGAACLSVVLFHSLESHAVNSLCFPLAAMRTVSSVGWLGVHVFFALSGWCIAERLSAARRRRESARQFLVDRLLRIFPTYWAALLLLLAVRVIAQPFNHTPLAANLPAGPIGWLADLSLLNPYLGHPATLMVSWSLVYELGFYALAALALALARRGVSATQLIVVGIMFCCWPMAGIYVSGTLVLGLWPSFFCGVIAWWSTRHHSAARLATGATFFVLMAVLAATGTLGLSGPSSAAALTTGFMLFAAGALRVGQLPNLLPLRGLLSVGAASYSIYLVHVTVMSPFQNLFARMVPPTSMAFVIVWLAAVSLGVVIGLIFYQQVELRFERLRRRAMTRQSVR